MVAELLAKVAVLRGIPPEGLLLLAQQGRRRLYEPGEVVIRQGEPAGALHVVLVGRVLLARTHPAMTEVVRLRECGPGDLLGARGVLDGVQQPYGATAATAAGTLELSAPLLALMALRYPDTTAPLMRVLGGRFLPAGRGAFLERLEEAARDARQAGTG